MEKISPIGWEWWNGGYLSLDIAAAMSFFFLYKKETNT
jgi:hypothetical protein